MELTEIGECLSLEFSTPKDASEVFRNSRVSLIEEMFFVLKRANPISDHRDDSDESQGPATKRKRRSYDFSDEHNERESAEEATLTSESSQEYDGGEDADEYDYDKSIPAIQNSLASLSLPVEEPCPSD